MTAAVIEPAIPPTRPQRQPINSPLTLRELLTPVFHHRQLALLAFLLPVALAIVIALVLRPVYVAESRLLILPGDEYVFRGDSTGASQGLTFDRAQIVQAEIEILAAKDLHAEAIRQIGLAKVYPDLVGEPHGAELAEIRFDKDLTLVNVPQSNVVALTLRNHDAKVASDLLNRLVGLYIERRRDVFQQADLTKINSERDQLQQRLGAVEAQIADFSAAHGFGDYDQALTAAQTEQATLATQLEALDAQYATRSGRTAQLGQRIRQTPQSMELYSDRARSQQVEALTSSLLALQNQRREAAAKYADTYPLVADYDRRIAELQAQIAAAPKQQLSTVRMGANPTREQLDTELADSEGDLAGLRQGRVETARALQAAETRLRDLADIGPQYRELVRTRTTIETAFADLAKRAEDSRLADALSRSRANVRVVQAATPPVKGTTGRLLLLGAGVVLGLACASASVLFAAAFSEEMVTPRDVEQKLDVPIILALPWRAERRDEERRGGLRSFVGAHLSVDDCSLLLRLAASIAPGRCAAVQLIAADEAAGVSSLALDLALQASAQGARRVLLIDMEPPEGRGAAARLNAAGAKLMREPGQRVIQVEGASLSISLPIGTRDLRIDENQWEGVLNRARQAYDLIIVDSPASARSAAGIVIAPYVDISLLVVEAEATRAAVARNLIDRIDAGGGQVIGAILNKRRFHIPPAIYSKL